MIALAGRAPSIHNSQPWRWVAGDNSLHLFADRSRHLPATDPDGRDLLMSCGAALHHLRVGFAAAGWDTIVHRLPNPALPDHLAAVEFTSGNPTAEDIALSTAIAHRRTDRRRFTSWPVPEGLLDMVAERAVGQGALAAAATNPDDRFRLTSAIADAARQQDANPEYRSELAAWAGRGSAAEDGVPATSTPRTTVPHGDTTMRAFPDGVLTQVREGWEDDAGELIVLATTADDRVSRLQAGEAMSAVLLAATDLGLATCPLSQPLEVRGIRELLGATVLGGVAFPQMVLRIGWAPTDQGQVPATSRRAVDDVLASPADSGDGQGSPWTG
ncbi:Acg family FMN-binding oxidoreductase [Umezawaea sp. Da 62-37]|uniref:Acg family FMN-binding oxidoreductase n=1 Tax=Umezawaea sp. Da 62-37 TaxID=3075927 RepID=UPI0028F70BB6|nr:nitroreductase family protein [Umezawaea sp. Da 62-37]WNV84811.1 nitroreductase family protein [Umezawaea sp. Da 62-37]